MASQGPPPSAPSSSFLLSRTSWLAFTLPKQVPAHLEILSMTPITHSPLPSPHTDLLLVSPQDAMSTSNHQPQHTTHTHTQEAHTRAYTDTQLHTHTSHTHTVMSFKCVFVLLVRGG